MGGVTELSDSNVAMCYSVHSTCSSGVKTDMVIRWAPALKRGLKMYHSVSIYCLKTSCVLYIYLSAFEEENGPCSLTRVLSSAHRHYRLLQQKNEDPALVFATWGYFTSPAVWYLSCSWMLGLGCTLQDVQVRFQIVTYMPPISRRHRRTSSDLLTLSGSSCEFFKRYMKTRIHLCTKLNKTW